MSPFRPVSLFLLCAAAVLRGQTPPGASPSTGGPIERLDKFVVSAGPDPKTSFDLAQGTSVLTGEDLRRAAQATLGATLAATAGVTATSYGPGSSRPVIRGLGGDRVRVLDNGVGALDASSVSPDHNTALEPLFATRIEVLRGPSTLLYGSSAVGGAVNVIDNRIPDAPPERPFSGVLELRVGGAADERTGVLSARSGGQRFALQVNALDQRTGNVAIPGVARIDADAPAGQPRATLPDSATDTRSGSLGAGLFWAAGHGGAALSRYETNYGVPADEPGLGIRMRQTRLDLAGEVTRPFGAFRGARARLGFGDYTHSEVVGDTVNTTFNNRAWEGRLELPHATVGALTGTVGAQGARSDFSAEGEEVVTPPSVTQSAALFALEEFKLSDPVTLQFGARAERQTIALGEVAPDLPPVPGYAARAHQQKIHRGLSASLGAVWRPAKDWSVGTALAYTERLPTAQELFSHGPHGGTGAYEVGTTGLAPERSLGFDLSVRRRTGFVTGSASVFVNRFAGYIFEQALPPGAIPEQRNPEGLTPYQFVARDARFHGGELELSLHLIDETARHLHLDLMADTTRAEQTVDDEPLPRIPPWRCGAKLSYDDGRWSADLEVRRVARQDRLATGEAATPGYTLLNAGLGVVIPAERVSWELYLRGTNLANAEARDHGSFLKAFAPLPGRGVTTGVRLLF